MDLINILIQLVSGAVGGNLAGALLKNFSLGTLGNSIAGIVGGGLGGQILSALLGGGAAPAPDVAAAAGGMDLGAIIQSVAGGGVGGGVLMVVVGLVRGMMGGQRG